MTLCASQFSVSTSSLPPYTPAALVTCALIEYFSFHRAKC